MNSKYLPYQFRRDLDLKKAEYPPDDGPISDEYLKWLKEYVATHYPPKGELKLVSSLFDKISESSVSASSKKRSHK